MVPLRRAQDHFRHSAVFRSLFDQHITPAAVSAPHTPPLHRTAQGPSSQDTLGTTPDSQPPTGGDGEPVLYTGFSSLLEGQQQNGRNGGAAPRVEEVAARSPGEPERASGALRKVTARRHATAELLGAPVDTGDRVAKGNRVARPRVITVPAVSRRTVRAAAAQVTTVRRASAGAKLRSEVRTARGRGGDDDAGGARQGKGQACTQGRAVSPGRRGAEEGFTKGVPGPGGDQADRRSVELRHRDVIAAAAAAVQQRG